jgi:hypothetical protein
MGASDRLQKEMENDRMLLKNGARMSTIMFSAVELLNQRQFPEMLVPSIHAGVRAVVGDTRRLESMMNHMGCFGSFIQGADYEKAVTELMGIREFPKARDTHLLLLHENLGVNLRACYKSNLGIESPAHATEQNLDLTARMTDSGDLVPSDKHGYQSRVLMENWLENAIQTYYYAFRDQEPMRNQLAYLESPYFRRLTEGFLGKDAETYRKRAIEWYQRDGNFGSIDITLANGWRETQK